MRENLIKMFNKLGIEGMPQITELNEVKGDFINLEYKLPGGQTIKLWDDNKVYYGNQICKGNSNRCYGLIADDNYMLVCEYGEGGADAEIIVLRKL